MERIIYCQAPASTEKDTQRTMEAQLTQRARALIAAHFTQLLEIDPDEGARWMGPVTDLMEAAHTAYDEAACIDDVGNPLSFRALVAMACLCLHVRPPRNPRSRACKAASRKGVRRASLLSRYRLRLRLGLQANLLAGMVARGRGVHH